MRRATLLTIIALLSAPAAADAKGVIVNWDRYPEAVAVGDSVDFTIMMPPMRGRRPLVTFRSASGKIVRVRTTRADLNGIAYGKVAFPDRGPWGTEVHAGTTTIHSQDAQPFEVGVGLTQTIPAANAARPKPVAPADEGSAFPWAWIASLGAIGSALMVFTMRRRGRWGAA